MTEKKTEFKIWAHVEKIETSEDGQETFVDIGDEVLIGVFNTLEEAARRTRQLEIRKIEFSPRSRVYREEEEEMPMTKTSETKEAAVRYIQSMAKDQGYEVSKEEAYKIYRQCLKEAGQDGLHDRVKEYFQN